MNDRKIIMMPGSVYNEHVDQQNIFPALRQVENKFSENGACTAEEASTEAEMAVDDKIRLALQVMRREEVLKYGYDYAWVMLAMDGTAELPHFKSVQSFWNTSGRRWAWTDCPASRPSARRSGTQEGGIPTGLSPIRTMRANVPGATTWPAAS